MFEKLIINLKKSLPEALRRKLGEADDIDQEIVFEEIQNDSNEVIQEGVAEDLEEELEEDKQKKMKSMIIKVIVVLALGYFAIDEFLLKENPESRVAESTAQTPKQKKIIETETTTETPPIESVTQTTENEGSSTEETAKEETPPIENVNVLEKNDESIPSEPVDTPAETQTDTQTETLPEQVVSQSRVGESTVDKKLDSLVDNLEQTAQSNPIEEIKIPSSGQSDSAPSMMSKIVEDIAETLPPVYDQLGRGLVYNCKDKFWACLDKPAYLTCSKTKNLISLKVIQQNAWWLIFIAQMKTVPWFKNIM